MKDKELAKGSAILFILLMASNLLNGLFQIMLGKILNDEVLYGIISALISFFNIASLPVAFISLLVTKYTAEFNIQEENGRIKSFLLIIYRYVIILSILVFILGICIAPTVDNYLKIKDLPLIILMFCSAIVTYFMQIPMGYFQGSKKFASYGIYNLIVPILRILFCFFFIGRGIKLYGVAISFLLSTFIAVIIGFFWLRKIFKAEKKQKVNIKKKDIMLFSYTTILLNIANTFLYNIDMILVKHYFTLEVGYYSVASTLAKLILFAVNVIIIAMFPLAVEKKGEKQKEKRMLKKALGFGVLISLSVAFFLNVGGKIIITIMYNESFLDAEKYMLPISLFIVALSVLSIISNFDLACGNAGFVIGSMYASVLLSFVAVSLFHNNILQVVWILSGIICFIAFINIVFAFGKHNNRNGGKKNERKKCWL